MKYRTSVRRIAPWRSVLFISTLVFLAYHEIARWCSSLLSVAVINSLAKSSLERKGPVSPYSLLLSREAKAGTEVETTEECCEAKAQSVPFTTQTYLPGVALTVVGWALPRQSRSAPQTCPQANLMEAGSQLRFPLFKWYEFVSNWEKLPSTDGHAYMWRCSQSWDGTHAEQETYQRLKCLHKRSCGGQRSNSSHCSCTIHLVFEIGALSVAWNSSSRLGWLASEPQIYACLYFPCTGISKCVPQCLDFIFKCGWILVSNQV